MNVMISSCGRQEYLLNSFHSVMRSKGKLFAADIDENASALRFADEVVKPPRVDSTEYVNWIVSYCKKNEIRLLLTLNVKELFVLESLREQLDAISCQLVGGPYGSVVEASNKSELQNICRKLGLPNLNDFALDQWESIPFEHFPVIVKPIKGQGSLGITVFNHADTLQQFVQEEENREDYLIQRFLTGSEYGFDLINSFDSKFQGLLARRKFNMKNGETDAAITVDPSKWVDMFMKLSGYLKHQGLIDIDAIESDGQLYLIDINHRFGGGYIYNHFGGANVPSAYLDWMEGRETSLEFFKYDLGIFGQRNNTGLNLSMEP